MFLVGEHNKGLQNGSFLLPKTTNPGEPLRQGHKHPNTKEAVKEGHAGSLCIWGGYNLIPGYLAALVLQAISDISSCILTLHHHA